MKFSKQKRHQIINTIANSKFDIVFNSYGAVEIITMFIASLNNYKCAMIVDGDFFSHENTFISENADIVNALSTKFPSYLLEEELLSLYNSNTVVSNLNKILGKNIYNKDVNKYEPLLKMDFFNSYSLKKIRKINLQPLLFAMMKTSLDRGALAINHTSLRNEKQKAFIVNEGIETKINTKHIFLPQSEKYNEKYNFKLFRNDFRLKRSVNIECPDINIKLIRRQEHIDVIVDCESDLSKKIKIASIQAINKVINLEKDIKISDTSELIKFNSLKSIDEIFKNSYLFIKALNDKKISNTQHLISTISTNTNNINQLYELIILCEEKYNEAKQLGVDAMYFRNKFYQHINDIDYIIEKAYDLYSPSLEGNELFFYAEVYFLVNFQAVSSVQDYQNRVSEILNNKQKEKCKTIITNIL